MSEFIIIRNAYSNMVDDLLNQNRLVWGRFLVKRTSYKSDWNESATLVKK